MGLTQRRNHSEECGDRIEKEMAESETGRDKLQRAKERLDFRTAQAGKKIIIEEDNGQAAEGGAEASGEVTELIEGAQDSWEDASHLADDGRLAESLAVELEDRAAAR